MTEKKNEVITLRTEKWVKDELQKVANYNKWSIAQTANQILINYLINPRPERITINSEDFINAAIAIRKEKGSKAVEISIELKQNEESQEVHKYMTYRLLECGGLGCIDDFEDIKEMTDDEIKNLP